MSTTLTATTTRSTPTAPPGDRSRLLGLVRWYLHLVTLATATPRPPRQRGRGDAGQATTEYALVLLAAALVALLVVAWATAGGGAAAIGRLFDRVIDAVSDRI